MLVKQFIRENYKHFNAAVVADAAEALYQHLEKGGKMFLAMAGAMSTGEIGISLGEMIQQNKVHGISCTGANLEEDILNLIAHNSFKHVPHYRYLTPKEELELRNANYSRVTDTCIPSDAMRKLEEKIFPFWAQAERDGQKYYPYEFVYQMIRSGCLDEHCQIPRKHSWVVAASEKDIPIFTPGWEDSTLGNALIARTRKRHFKNFSFVKNGLEQMDYLVDWYLNNSKNHAMGFFQIGGGIAGDFAICVVPLIRQDLKQDCKLWNYFCQISDSTTSYGSYSGAVPNEKITWDKLGADTPGFIIESDASIVAPLIFKYVLGQ